MSRSSEVELRKSETAERVKSFEMTSKLSIFVPKRNSCSKCAIGGLVTIFLVNIIIAVCYGVFTSSINHAVEDASRICSSDSTLSDTFSDPQSQEISIWIYNISNPYEYISGESAIMLETGVYGYDFQINRGNIIYDGKEDTVSYNLWFNIDFNSKKSCPTCENDKELAMFNPAYNFIIGTSQHEAALLLTMTCSPTQISLIPDSPSSLPIPYCTAAEQRTGTVCRCCATTTPNATAILCSTITVPSSKAGGIVSYLSKYDHGLKLSSDPSGFILSDGAYTSLIRYLTPYQLLKGSTSAVVGFFQVQNSILAGDTETVSLVANVTRDMRDVCYAMYCPSIDEAFATLVGGGGLAYIKSLSCNGTVPSPEGLMEFYPNMTSERAQSLAYLEGSDCDGFTVSVVLAVLVRLTAGTITCAIEGDVAPCCPTYLKAGALETAAFGCLAYNQGLLVERPINDNADAEANLDPTPFTKHNTGCAASSNKFDQVIWRGESEFNQWFTPSTYASPSDSMYWADPLQINQARMGTLPGGGVMKIGNVTGKQFSSRAGKGVDSAFLEYQFTNGKPKEDSAELWVPFRRGAIQTEYASDKQISGIDANTFEPILVFDTTVEGVVTSQQNGNLPYQNMQNLVYLLSGRPVIMSQPNFYFSNAEMLSQEDNEERYSDDGGGIFLYRTHDGYDVDSPELTNYERITDYSVITLGPEYYAGSLDVEPATGVTIGGSLVNMVSTYTWNCNPLLDKSCSLQVQQNNGSNALCYYNSPFPDQTMYPCSAFNVFTPNVKGGKVAPLYWLRLDPDASDVYDIILSAMDVRYSLSILMLSIPLISFVAILVIVYVEWYRKGRDDDEIGLMKSNQNEENGGGI